MTQMTDKQLRGECDAPLYHDPLVPDACFPGRHSCPHCGEQLATVECTASCPHAEECEDCLLHESAGRFWCTTLQEVMRE